MQLLRNITVVTANLGRGATVPQFEANVDRLKKQVPGKSVFWGFQEIDEGDVPDEMKYLREVFGDSHRFVGTKTHVPILVPKTFGVARRNVDQGSDGVKKLQPDRYVVRAVVYPEGHKDRKVAGINTHIGRNIEALQDERVEDVQNLRAEVRKPLASWVTADLNTHNHPILEQPERRVVTAGLDYIRVYPSDDVRFRVINKGTVRLVGDGHNAHWAQMHVIWR